MFNYIPSTIIECFTKQNVIYLVIFPVLTWALFKYSNSTTSRSQINRKRSSYPVEDPHLPSTTPHLPSKTPQPSFSRRRPPISRRRLLSPPQPSSALLSPPQPSSSLLRTSLSSLPPIPLAN